MQNDIREVLTILTNLSRTNEDKTLSFFISF
jgi:hypothetical protein